MVLNQLKSFLYLFFFTLKGATKNLRQKTFFKFYPGFVTLKGANKSVRQMTIFKLCPCLKIPLIIKVSITTAADDKFYAIFLNLRKIRYDILESSHKISCLIYSIKYFMVSENDSVLIFILPFTRIVVCSLICLYTVKTRKIKLLFFHNTR